MKRSRILQCTRVLHLWMGIFAAVYLAVVVLTGVAINHSRTLHLNDSYITRTWLPVVYRAQESAVRADVVISDLHSGLIFGRIGTPMMDAVAASCLLLFVSGFAIFVLGGSVYTEPLPRRESSPGPKELLSETRGREPIVMASPKSQRTAKVLIFKAKR